MRRTAGYNSPRGASTPPRLADIVSVEEGSVEVKDQFGARFFVPRTFQRSRDPFVGETWLIDFDLGQPSLRCPVDSDVSYVVEGGGVPTGGVPVGGIILYDGDLQDLPPNWAPCDGSNGTPDLDDYGSLPWVKRLW